MLSSDNIIISKAEEEHALLKRSLRSSVEDLNKIIKIIELMLKNPRSEYLIAHEEDKTRVFKECALSDLKNLRAYISFLALRLIRKQLNKLNKVKNSSTSLSSCNKIYETSMRLSCAYVIERQINNFESSQPENVHSRWRIYDVDSAGNTRVEEMTMQKTEDMREVSKISKISKVSKMKNDLKIKTNKN